MALSADGQELLNFALEALPDWMNPDDEFLHGCAAMFAQVKAQVDYWFGQALIKNAVGATSTTPDWLNEHARDRDTNRQNAELDPALRARLRNVPTAVTRASLIAAANAILAAQGVAGTASMVELPRDAAHLGTFTANTGTGGTFAPNGASPGFQFTPTVPFAAPPFRDPSVVRLIQGYSVTIAGSSASGNNGTFAITSLNGNAAVYANASGVAGGDAGATWTINKLDRRGNMISGHGKAFLSRGFRLTHAGKPQTFVLMLPYGTTAGTLAGVAEMLRQKKAAGFLAIVERRLNP